MKGKDTAVFAVLVLAAAVAATAQTYTVTDLGVLKGDNESSGFWINNLGDVVGCSDTATAEGYPCTGLVPGQHAFVWSKSGGMKDLGTLSGATVSGAQGINDSGTVVGYSNVKGQAATNFVAVEWSSKGVITDLGALSGGSSSAAFQINSAGEIAGDSFLKSATVDATSWTSNQIKSLGGLTKSVFNAGLDINDKGDIVGESVLSYGPPVRLARIFLERIESDESGSAAGRDYQHRQCDQYFRRDCRRIRWNFDGRPMARRDVGHVTQNSRSRSDQLGKLQHSLCTERFGRGCGLWKSLQ